MLLTNCETCGHGVRVYCTSSRPHDRGGIACKGRGGLPLARRCSPEMLRQMSSRVKHPVARKFHPRETFLDLLQRKSCKGTIGKVVH